MFGSKLCDRRSRLDPSPISKMLKPTLRRSATAIAKHYGTTLEIITGQGEFPGDHEAGSDREQRDDARRVIDEAANSSVCRVRSVSS